LAQQTFEGALPPNVAPWLRACVQNMMLEVETQIKHRSKCTFWLTSALYSIPNHYVTRLTSDRATRSTS